MFVEKVSIWNVTSENTSKKALDSFGFEVVDINISDNFYKNKSLNNGQFFSLQYSLLILYFPKSLGL